MVGERLGLLAKVNGPSTLLDMTQSVGGRLK